MLKLSDGSECSREFICLAPPAKNYLLSTVSRLIKFILLFTMSPPTYVAPSGPDKNLRSRVTPTPPVHGGASHPDSSSTSAPPPTIPQDGATTRAPPHRKDQPSASPPEESPFTPVSGCKITRMDQAIVATLGPPTPQSPYAGVDNDSFAPADRTQDTDNAIILDNGDSQPLIDEITLPCHNDPIVDGYAIVDGTMIVNALTELDCIMTLAIADVVDPRHLNGARPPPAGMIPVTMPTNAPRLNLRWLR